MLYFNKKNPNDISIFVSDKMTVENIKIVLKGEITKGVVEMNPLFTINNNKLTIDKSNFANLENDVYYLEVLINTDGEDKVIGADFLDVFNKKVAKTFYESYINYKQYEKHD